MGESEGNWDSRTNRMIFWLTFLKRFSSVKLLRQNWFGIDLSTHREFHQHQTVKDEKGDEALLSEIKGHLYVPSMC